MRYQTKIALAIILFALFLPGLGQTAEVPGAPSELKLKIEGKGFLLTWKASPNDPEIVTGYEIARAEVASGPFSTVGTVKKGVVKYWDKEARSENIYYYKVRAMSGKSGEKYSPYSNVVTGELTGI